ncbi:MAG TPA: hypothetical protein VF152_10035 [Acidimicrobiia bacterium]
MTLHHARPSGVPAAVAASFPDMEAARGAIEALENVGVDGDDIDLLGQRAEAARVPSSPSRADRRVAGHMARRIALGAVVGAGAGALVGVVLGLIVLAVTSVGGGAGLVFAFGLIGVGMGVVVMVFLSFERSVGFSDAWPLTFEDAPEGSVWVAIYTRDPKTRDRADDALVRLRPLEVRRAAA